MQRAATTAAGRPRPGYGSMAEPGTDGHSITTSATPARADRRPGRRWALGAVVGTGTGLAPHLVHHVGLVVGTAIVTGAAGTAVFGAVGLATMMPTLIRLRRRFSSWWAPIIGLGVFAAMFTMSTAVIGPWLRSAVDDSPRQPQHSPTAPGADEHSRHHARTPHRGSPVDSDAGGSSHSHQQRDRLCRIVRTSAFLVNTAGRR